MKNLGIKLSLYINYFVFAILLNSVGIVILKSLENYGVDEVEASTLEAFKDLPIVFISFIIGSFLPRIGYKKAMLAGLFISGVACIAMYYGNTFDTAKILFAAVGLSFALIKVSVYSAIGLVTNDAKEHSSLMSSIEGFFMVGIAVAYFLFPAFNSDSDPDAWLRVYWLLAGLSFVSFIFLLFTKFDEGNEIPGSSFKDDIVQSFKLCAQIFILVFICSAFLFVMVEQGIMTWLPEFNKRVLSLPSNVSIMMASIFALSLAVGRIAAGALAKRIPWIYILTFCILIAMIMVVVILPNALQANVGTIESIADIPLIGFTFPIIGLFIAPIYPLLNSTALSALPKKVHSPMTGLIVLFSALGGTLGSRAIGWLFRQVGADAAFYYTLIPMTLLLISIFVLHIMTKKAAAKQQALNENEHVVGPIGNIE